MHPSGLHAGLDAEIGRLAERLSTLSTARLAAPCGTYASAAQAAHALAQTLADTAQGLAEAGRAGPPVWRDVPRLSDLAAGDQVRVTGRELVDVGVEGVGPEVVVWTRTGRRPAAEILDVVRQQVAALRRAL